MLWNTSWLKFLSIAKYKKTLITAVVTFQHLHLLMGLINLLIYQWCILLQLAMVCVLPQSHTMDKWQWAHGQCETTDNVTTAVSHVLDNWPFLSKCPAQHIFVMHARSHGKSDVKRHKWALHPGQLLLLMMHMANGKDLIWQMEMTDFLQ